MENELRKLLIDFNLKLMETIVKANQILTNVSQNNLKAYIYSVNYYLYHLSKYVINKMNYVKEKNMIEVTSVLG